MEETTQKEEATQKAGAVVAEPTLEEKLKAAKLAMEGEEYTAKREAREKEKTTKAKHEQIERRLTEISAEKEKLEVGWIELDEKRTTLKNALTPILEEESKSENEETAIEEEERKTVIAADRQGLEKRRFEVQATRRKIEETKWELEDKVGKIEKLIEENTAAYRKFLDEEENLHAELSQIEES